MHGFSVSKGFRLSLESIPLGVSKGHGLRDEHAQGHVIRWKSLPFSGFPSVRQPVGHTLCSKQQSALGNVVHKRTKGTGLR